MSIYVDTHGFDHEDIYVNLDRQRFRLTKIKMDLNMTLKTLAAAEA
jgi:hypothetical protein